ncbi:MAG: hypothetical protein LBF62_05535 [Tannerellaceae bacterium]|jgi:hypothetical protein|nr:hypothetical protein [Tannerellaceae bacterium]
MNKELFKVDLWESIKQAATNLRYLDKFRDKKEHIEPRYKGVLAIAATLSAIISFFDIDLLTKIMAVATATIVVLPFFFPIIPKSSDFNRMSELRKDHQ